MLFIKNWWLLALRGISSVFFGLYFFIYPELALELLFKGFCLYAFTDGAFCILAALFSARNMWLRLIFLLAGLLSIAAGALALYQPLLASVSLLVSIGLWAIFTGAVELAAAYILKSDFEGFRWLKISGIVSLLLGVFLLVQPFVGIVSLAVLIGIFQIIRGIINLLISFSLKRNRNDIEKDLEILAKS